MSQKLPRTATYLEHMQEAAKRILAYIDGIDRSAFELDVRTQDAVIRNLEVIGEAARNIMNADPGYVSMYPEIPWAKAYRMRNALTHGYADIDLDIIWQTIRVEIPTLVDQLAILTTKP